MLTWDAILKHYRDKDIFPYLPGTWVKYIQPEDVSYTIDEIQAIVLSKNDVKYLLLSGITISHRDIAEIRTLPVYDVDDRLGG